MSYLCKGAVVTRCRKSIGGSILPLLMAGIALALLAQGSTALGQHGVRAAPSPVARTAPPGKFADVLIPYGIAVDGDGYVYASSVDPNNVFQYLLTQYDSNGTVLQQVASGEGGNLAWDAGGEQLWMLSEGRLLVVNPETLGMTLQTDVASLAVDTSNVYDVATGLAFSGVIDTALATYEDLALYRSGERLDVFIAGYYNAWQFVMRVRFQGSAVQSAQGIVTSGASLAPYDNGPHGVAVNRQGTVLTTLGYAPPNSEEGTVDRAVAFGVGYPEDPGQAPQYVLDDQQTFGSRGMGSDALGNFYVASGLAGGGLACSGASCLMVVPPGLDGVACYPLEAVTANPLDVASSPAGDAVYVMDADTDIFSENDVIWAFRFQRVYLPLVLGETL